MNDKPLATTEEPVPEKTAGAAKTPPKEQMPPDEAERLAAEFLELRAEMPEFKDIDDVPEAALQTAAEGHLPLLDAVLRYRFREMRAVQQEQERQLRAGAAAAGSLYSGGGRQQPEADAFTRAFEQALR